MTKTCLRTTFIAGGNLIPQYSKYEIDAKFTKKKRGKSEKPH